MIADFDIGDEISIDSKKFKVLDFRSHIYVYKEMPHGFDETTVQEWFLMDNNGKMFRLEIPLNGDKGLLKFYEINGKGRIITGHLFKNIEVHRQKEGCNHKL